MLELGRIINFFRGIAVFLLMQFSSPSSTVMGIRLMPNIGCWFVRVEKEFQILPNISVFPQIPDIRSRQT